MPFLRVIKGLDTNQQFPVEGERSILGRHPDCDVVLEVGAVSRQHAQISRRDGQYLVEDLGSRNGTFLNGERVETPTALREDDQITICDLVFSFHLDLPAPAGGPGGGFGLGSDLPTLGAMVDDQDEGQSTIMSKIDVLSTAAGLRVTVNPEVKLRALIEISKNLASAVKMDQVLPKILESLFKVFVQADRGFIVLQDPSGRLAPHAVRYRRDQGDETVRLSRTILKQVMETKQAILSADAATDSRFSMSESIADFRIRSMMCAPLVSSDGVALGAIQIDTLDQRSRFQEDDLEVLASVAAQAAFALENAQLHEAALEQQAIARDLALAHNIQIGFLPQEAPQVPGYEFFQFYEPANQVGGDFFDYVPLANGRLAVFAADVSGKGVSAALLMVRVLSEARFCLAAEAEPGAAIKRLSQAFSAMGWDDRFVTLLLMVLDPRTHEVTLVNAGHMPPFWRRADGSVEEAGDEITGVPLGVDPDWDYEELTLQLAPGESLTTFTDGFSEAANAAGDMFGLERLQAQVARSADVQRMGSDILTAVKQFVAGYKQSDDMCLLCLGRQAE